LEVEADETEVGRKRKGLHGHTYAKTMDKVTEVEHREFLMDLLKFQKHDMRDTASPPGSF